MSYTILLVDDSATTRDMIARTLSLAKVPVAGIHQAANGQEALDVLRNNWVDLVFADINMPVMDGIEMLARMKEDPVLARIPVIVVSTDGSTSRMEQLAAKGVKAYLRKPFTPERLRAKVEEVLGGQPV